MDDKTLAAYIQQVIKSAVQDDVIFVWQGGEPTLAGLDFFQRAQRWQQMFRADKRILNHLHTNGILINDAWCQFLAQHQWRVELTVDGLPRAHNQYRVFANDRGSYDALESALALLLKFNIDIHAHVTVHASNVISPLETYEHLKALGIRSMQFHPLAPSEQSPEVKPWHLRGNAFGNFLTAILDRWLDEDVNTIYIADFHSAYASKNGLPASVCAHTPTCGNAFALLKNGEVYSCEHYVGAENYLGNINHRSLQQVSLSPQNIRFGLEKALTRPEACQQCDILTQCQGGCPRHRLFNGVSHLCESYQQFFRHFNESSAHLPEQKSAKLAQTR